MNINHKLYTLADVLKNRPHTFWGVIFGKIAKWGIFNGLSDEKYISLQYRLMLGKKLNLDSPRTFNEKLQWLKLNNRKPILTQMVDKYQVRKIIKEKIGDEYLVPLLGVYSSPEEIDIDALPDAFVLKCNHDSGSVIVCRDKNTFDFENAKKVLDRHMKKNQFWWAREWPYLNVKPCIICEKYMKDDNNDNLPVYKFLCFNGEPEIIQVIQDDKQINESIDYFDCHWNLLEMRQDYPNSTNHYKKPLLLNNMLDIVRILANNMPFVRVDLYLINDKIYFSEFTMFSDAGIARFYPYDWDNKLGDLIDLSRIEKSEVYG